MRADREAYEVALLGYHGGDVTPIGRAGYERHKVGKIEGGRYVPDAANVDICLNCTAPKCKGFCSLVRSARRERKK